EAKSDTREGLFEKLTSNIDREAAAGSTLWGPHKDDIHISINGKEARLFASQGQQRSIALSMKLAEGEISKRLTGEYPVFLLDDVFSELDERRRAFIMESLRGRQIIVTSCEPSVVPGGGAGDIAYFRVSDGKVEARQNG
ncbi:MAG: DNA replication/repair protein RecF, partial [Clostridia bacterium]|nr:DNA replication/repair protein RecF [Clostridia bacterium]